MDNKVSQARAFTPISEIYEIGSNPSSILKLDQTEALIKPEDTTNIQFTSGTTGSPKAATLSHFSLLNNGLMIADRLNYTSSDKILCSVPLYHCFGMVLSNMAAITNGCEVLFASEVFDAELSMKVCSEK